MVIRSLAVAAIALLVSCGGSDAAPSAAVLAEPTPIATPLEQPAPDAIEDATPVARTAEPDAERPTPEPQVPLDLTGSAIAVNWDALPSTPFYSPADPGAPDPFFHIHTNPDLDGFFLSFELYTTGYGSAWTGEPGLTAIGCDTPASTGICPYFDPDGSGPMPVLGGDFATTGSMTIIELSSAGYEFIVHELVFADGTTFDEFTVEG